MMQKAKCGDLIYLTKDNGYARVTKALKHGGILYGDLAGDVDGGLTCGEADECDYQIVFSPHADSLLSDESIQLLAKAVADGINGDKKTHLASAKSSDFTGGEATEDPERALIGDKVQGLGGFRALGTKTAIWQVIRLWSGGVFVDMGGHDAYLPDGYYVVVERAADRARKAPTPKPWLAEVSTDALRNELWLRGEKITDNPVWSIDDARTFRAIIKDYEESAVAAYKRDVSTAELVAMLAKRKGVVEFQGAENPFLATPCTILVIPEDAK